MISDPVKGICLALFGKHVEVFFKQCSRLLVKQLAGNSTAAYEITFERADERFRRGAAFSFLNASGRGFIVWKSTFGPNRARCIVANASDGLIDGCTFNKCEGIAVQSRPSVPWLEGGCARNLTVRNSTFYDTFWVALAIGKLPVTPKTHANFVVTNNVFKGSARIAVESCSGCDFSNNSFERKDCFRLVNVENVRPAGVLSRELLVNSR